MRSGDLARPVFGINHVLSYGQSLSSGWEGWPALSRRPRGGSLMLGQSVHAAQEWAPAWRPIGETAFSPLAATVISPADGSVMSDAAVAALPQGRVALGETVLEAAVNMWRAALDGSGFAPERQALLASACGVGGRTLEQLSRGAEPELFNRLRDCAALARGVAAQGGRDYGIVALLFLQGESNSRGLNGGTTERDGYAALLRRFQRDFLADIVGDGQAAPAMFLHQTGGAYASADQAIAQAQLDVALSEPGCVMVGPAYAVTAKGGHLDANGYRWLGAQFGKVMHRVIGLGEAWKPLHPLRARVDGGRVVLDFHVPVGPLRWGRPYVDLRRPEIADRGFALIDAGGAVKLRRVEIDGGRSVALTPERPWRGPAVVRYACDAPHGGRGCLHDSDATVSPDCYEFDATTGHRLQADLSDIVGAHYPLMNWCAAFSLDVEEKRPGA